MVAEEASRWATSPTPDSRPPRCWYAGFPNHKETRMRPIKIELHPLSAAIGAVCTVTVFLIVSAAQLGPPLGQPFPTVRQAQRVTIVGPVA